MTIRTPNSGKQETERLKLIAHFEKKLAYFQRIPPWQRDAECADASEETCRAMLVDLGAPGHTPAKMTLEVTVELMTQYEFFAQDHH